MSDAMSDALASPLGPAGPSGQAVPSGAGQPSDAPLIADATLSAALEWQVTLWSGEVTASEQRAFARWRHADAAHEKAWQQVQRVSHQLHAVPGDISRQVLRAPQGKPLKGDRSAATRRHLLRGLGLLAGTGALAYGVRQTSPWQVAMAEHRSARGEHRSARGEQRQLTLPDGSLVVLNTASAVDLRFNATERRIVLRAGEILVTTAPDHAPAHRPLLVETGSGLIRALGTRFTVRDVDDWSAGEGRVRVQVLEGAVEIAPRHGGPLRRAAAGQQARFNADAVSAPEAADLVAAAWSEGLLVAERLRLADFLAELGRYRSGVLRCDPAVADLVVSGVYPVKDTDAILQALVQVLPVRLSMTTRYWVTVHAR